MIPHSHNEPIAPITPAQRDHWSPRRSSRLIVALAALLLVAVAVTACLMVRSSLQRLASESLRSNLSARVRTLETWLAERREDAAELVVDDNIQSSAKTLLQADAQALLDQKIDVAYQDLSGQLSFQDHRSDFIGWALLTTGGRVVASSHEMLIGKTLAIPTDALDQIQGRRPAVCRPFRCVVPIATEGNFAQSGGALMCAMAPITRGGRTEGALALMIDPLDRFAEILSVGHQGASGETYAFDRRGILISPSRFEDQLRDAGLLDESSQASSLLNVSIRDPGVDLTAGAAASSSLEEQPLTLMADQATRGAKGENVAGYNGYLGVPVVGAWQWLPDYGIGVATEMEVAQAFAPLHLLQKLLLILSGLVAAGGFAGWFLLPIIRHRRDPAGDDGPAPRQLGQYQLGELIGQGGMGAVYRGRHDVLKRDVAVKVLEGDEATSLAVQRFEREVQLTARLRHPNTIAIYDYGRTKEGAFFYVMEYIDGITLQDLINRYGRQSPQRVIHLLLQICGSLAEAHLQGLVHRDVKPANILVSARSGLYDMVKVLDFGLVKEIDRESTEVTLSDAITGTPMYMSPESVRDARSADERSDLYSIGAVGYTLLTGMPTFEGEIAVDICLKQLDEEPLRPCDRIGMPLPDDLQNVLMSCLRKDPQERPQSVDDLADALRQCKDAYHWSAGDAYRWWEEVIATAESEWTASPDSHHTERDDPDISTETPAGGQAGAVGQPRRLQNQDTAR